MMNCSSTRTPPSSRDQQVEQQQLLQVIQYLGNTYLATSRRCNAATRPPHHLATNCNNNNWSRLSKLLSTTEQAQNPNPRRPCPPPIRLPPLPLLRPSGPPRSPSSAFSTASSGPAWMPSSTKPRMSSSPPPSSSPRPPPRPPPPSLPNRLFSAIHWEK